MIELADVRKRLNEDPNDPAALLGAAKFYLNDGSYKQSQSAYLAAFLSQPRTLPRIIIDFEASIAAAPDKIGPRLSLAGFYLAIGQTDAAILELEEMLEENARNGSAGVGQVEGYNLLGRIYIKLNRIDEAIALLERSIAEGIRDVNLTETLAGAYLGKERISEAIKFYEELLNHKPGDKQTLRTLGELYARTEEYGRSARTYAAMFSDDPEVAREVVQRLEELLKKVEGSIEIREILADIFIKAMNPDAAVARLQEILRLESGKLAETVQKLKTILRSYPNHPAAVMALAEALRRQGNYSEAVEDYRQLIKAKPDMIDEIIAGYRQVLESCPEQVLARSYLGEALIMQEKVPEALDEFGQMIEADPSVADLVIQKCREVLRLQPQLLSAHVVLGQAYLAKSDIQRAIIEGEGAIALDKNLIGAYLMLGDAYARSNQPRKASQTLQIALSLDPYNSHIHDKFRAARDKEIDGEIEALKKRLHDDQWKVSLHFDLARLYFDKGRDEEAIRELQLAQKDQSRAAQACNLLGNIYRFEGRYDLAAAQYNRALESAEGELAQTIHFNLGTTFEAQGQVRKAIKIYEAILQENIDFGGLKKRVKLLKTTSVISMRNRSLVMVLQQYGQKEIMAMWGREIAGSNNAGKKEEVSVSFGQEHSQEGFEFFLKGMFPAAEEELGLAVQLDRRFGVALNNLGATLAKEGKLDEARTRLNEAVQAEPSSSVYYNNLGVINFLLGKTEAAVAALEKSLALNPELSAACLSLGDLCYFKKETKRAIELYRRVGDFDPLSDLARRRLFCKVP